jgi:hypothetical protein
MAADDRAASPLNPHDPAQDSVRHAQWALQHKAIVGLRESAEVGLTQSKPPRFAHEAIPVFLSYVVDLLQLRGVHVRRDVAHVLADDHTDILTLALTWMDTMMPIIDWDDPFLINLACVGGTYEGACVCALARSHDSRTQGRTARQCMHNAMTRSNHGSRS